MSEAYICDRCGAQISGSPPLKVGTKPNSVVRDDVPGGNVRAKTTENKSLGGRQIISADPINSAKAIIQQGDLCEDCADAFTEFWNEPGS